MISRRSAHHWVSGMALVLLAAPALAAEQSAKGRKEFPLKYRMSAQISQEIYCSGQGIQPTASKVKLAQEPKYVSKEPLYTTVQLGIKKEKFPIVLDNTTGGRTGYDILYVDADLDGRITEKEKLVGTPLGDRGNTFGPIKIMVSCCDEKCPQWFTFQLTEFELSGDANLFRQNVYRQLTVNNTGYYTGKVEFGDKKVLVAFVDANGNGLYDNCMTNQEHGCDRLAIDYNGDGKLDAGYNGEEAQPLGKYIQVGNRYWKVGVAADGASVTIEPLTMPLATVTAKVKDFTVLLKGDDGVVRLRSKDGNSRIPAGKYRLVQCKYNLTDDAGKKWEFQSESTQRGASLTAPPDGRAELVFGAPLIPKVTAHNNAGQMTLNLQLTGSGGEVYSNVQLENHQKPPVPKVKILDANNKELAMLDFHYG